MSNKMSKNWNKITDKEYTKIKNLLDAGLTVGQVVRVHGRSYATISAIKRSRNMQDYRDMVLKYAETYKERVRAKNGISKPVEAPNDSMTQNPPRPSFPKNHSEVTLTRIAVALERLADAWERQPEKKSTFFGK